MKIEFFKHNVGEDELREVKKVFNSPFLTTGEATHRLERNLAKYLGIKEAVGLTSCTGALHLALLAAGIKPGDEVITTPMSFVATAHAILMAGAKPVFVDVEPETGNINANLIEAAITKKTKAILPVHLYGQMADMEKILAIAQKRRLKVIEDAAHALEARRDGVRPGQKSFGACLSFYATKAITSGEGGSFATNDKKMAEYVRRLRSHGVTRELSQRQRLGSMAYDVDVLGWKYNMDNIQAALLLPQLGRVEKTWQRRAKIAEYYRQSLAKIGVTMPVIVSKSKHAHHLFTIWVSPRKRKNILNYLKTKDVSAAINYVPIHLFSFYRRQLGFKKGMFPVAEKISRQTISLPLYAKLTDVEVDYVIKQVQNAVRKA